MIWGGEEPQFESEQQMRTVLRTIMGRYNEIVTIMNSRPDSFEPIFERWPNGDVVVTDWAAGFVDAIKLRQKAWEPCFTGKIVRSRVHGDGVSEGEWVDLGQCFFQSKVVT